MIQQEEFTCRYPLQNEDRTFFWARNKLENENNLPSIQFWVQQFLFLRTFPWTNELIFLASRERWAKWFTPSCSPSKIFPSVWPSIHKAPATPDSMGKNHSTTTKREQPEITEDFSWTRFVGRFLGVLGGEESRFVALIVGILWLTRSKFTFYTNKWRWIGLLVTKGGNHYIFYSQPMPNTYIRQPHLMRSFFHPLFRWLSNKLFPWKGGGFVGRIIQWGHTLGGLPNSSGKINPTSWLPNLD